MPLPKISEDIVREFLDRGNVIAVVGASKDPDKWGHRLYKYFKGYFKRVYPVNPNADVIDGDKAYSNLSDLPELPDVVDIVVPPEVARDVVREAIKVGVKRIWFQPGSEDEEAISLCLSSGMKVVWGLCLMTETMKQL